MARHDTKAATAMRTACTRAKQDRDRKKGGLSSRVPEQGLSPLLAVCGIFATHARLIVLVVALALLGCGNGATPEPAEAGYVLAHVQTVDLDDQPLAGMTPIATTAPNAFDEPVATGQPTGPDGRGTLRLPPDRRLYVRAWDPASKRFANNYFDVPPDRDSETPLMRVVMVPGASLDARLVAPDGAPAAAANVGLMMFHPSKGPWWPAEADTDEEGNIHFPALPAGVYTIKLRALDTGDIEIPGVNLPPGGRTDLGVVVLQ